MEEKKLLNEELENASGGAMRYYGYPVFKSESAKEGTKAADAAVVGGASRLPGVQYGDIIVIAQDNSAVQGEYVVKGENVIF